MTQRRALSSNYGGLRARVWGKRRRRGLERGSQGRCGAYIGAEQTALACGPRAGLARRGAVGLCKSPSSSRARGRPRQAGPTCRWAAGEEAKAGWAGKEEGKRAGVRFPRLREEKEKREEGLGQAENELGKGKRFGIFLRRNKHIQLKFEFKEFKFKLKPK